ncbi:MAG: hypothetical protein J6P02_03495 [Lachnospiraceae bacterium]|nr:hypothetical protein [Lachnospiraceae bacterium]
MYKDSKKKEKQVKMFAIIFIFIILLVLAMIFIYETNYKKVEYKDIWGEEKKTNDVEFIEEELNPENITNNEIVNNYSDENNSHSEENENKTNISEYYAGNKNSLIVSTYSSVKYDIEKVSIPTRSNAISNIPNYHTGKIYYYDINDE